MPELTYEQAAVYLGAMLDGEGSVSRLGSRSPQIRFSNSNPHILQKVAEALEVIGIEPYGFALNRWGPRWVGYVRIGTRAGALKLLEASGDFIVTQKKECLAAMAAGKAGPNQHRLLFSRGEMRRLLDEGLSQRAVAKRLGVTPAAICLAIQKEG